MGGCPVSINIPGFIKEVEAGNFEAAANVIAESSALPAVCGRVCPQESQCEGKCIRGIKGENDFNRSERQRKLMELLLEKVLDGGMSMTKLNDLLNACMPYVQTNMKASTLFDLALGVLRSGISDRLTRGEALVEQHHVPMDGTYSYLDVDGASVINMGSKSFPKNVQALHEFIYGEYIPAD